MGRAISDPAVLAATSLRQLGVAPGSSALLRLTSGPQTTDVAATSAPNPPAAPPSAPSAPAPPESADLGTHPPSSAAVPAAALSAATQPAGPVTAPPPEPMVAEPTPPAGAAASLAAAEDRDGAALRSMLLEALTQLRGCCVDDELQAAMTLIARYVSNIVSAPHEPKYRSIRQVGAVSIRPAHHHNHPVPPCPTQPCSVSSRPTPPHPLEGGVCGACRSHHSLPLPATRLPAHPTARQGNAKFVAAVGRHAAARQLLRLLGFVDERRQGADPAWGAPRVTPATVLARFTFDRHLFWPRLPAPPPPPDRGPFP